MNESKSKTNKSKSNKEKSKEDMKNAKEHMKKSKEEMKKSKDELEKDLKKTAKELKAKSEESYNRIVGRLDNQRKNMQNMAREDYKEARRYVRSNPEEGLAMAFAGGLVLGLCLGLMRR